MSYLTNNIRLSIETMVRYYRYLEEAKPGSGLWELDELYSNSEIFLKNKTYDRIREAVANPDVDFEIEIIES